MGPNPIGIKFDEVIQKGGIYFQCFKTSHVGPIEEPQELSIRALEDPNFLIGVQLEESLAYSDLQEIRKLHGGAAYKNSKSLIKKALLLYGVWPTVKTSHISVKFGRGPYNRAIVSSNLYV